MLVEIPHTTLTVATGVTNGSGAIWISGPDMAAADELLTTVVVDPQQWRHEPRGL